MIVTILPFATLAEIDGEEIPFVTVTESKATEQPRTAEIKINPNETVKYSCTGTCVGKQTHQKNHQNEVSKTLR